MAEPDVRPEHRWIDDVCHECDLHRREAWVLDEQDRPVMTLVWSDPDGTLVRVRPFPVLRGVQPPVPLPTGRVEDVYPGIEVGREPRCRSVPVD